MGESIVLSTFFLASSLVFLAIAISGMVETRVIDGQTLELLLIFMLLWGVSHIGVVENGYIERKPSRMEYIGSTVSIGGEQKTITGFVGWGHKYEFSDGTFADEGYVRRTSSLKSYGKKSKFCWVWYWERYGNKKKV